MNITSGNDAADEPSANVSSLSLLLAANKRRLRPCHTLVTRVDGRCYTEKRSEGGFSVLPPRDTHDSRTEEPTPMGEKKNLNVSSLFKYSNHEGVNSKCPGFVIDTKPDLRISSVTPYLYVGSQDVANDVEILTKFKVSHILSLVPPNVLLNEPYLILGIDGKFRSSSPNVETLNPSVTRNPSLITGIETVHVPLLDTPEFQIQEYFDSCHRYLRRVKASEGVALVHCNAGVSRAPSVTIAFLMAEYSFTFHEAFEKVKEARTFIRPNVGFVEALKKYETILNSHNQ